MLISEFSFIEFFCNFNRNLFLIWVFLFYKNFYEEIYSCENFCLILLFNYNFQVQVFIYFIFEEEKNFLTLFKNQYFFFPSVTDENLIYSMSYIWICVLWWKIISKILFFSIFLIFCQFFQIFPSFFKNFHDFHRILIYFLFFH